MAVPGQDQRDWEFAEVFELPIIRTVRPPDGFDGKAYVGEGPAINSAAPDRGLVLDGLGIAEAKATIIAWLEGAGVGKGATTYRLRDWLFSRQRYWGEPFPIVYDETGLPVALPDSMLPVGLPEVDDFSPRTFAPDDANSDPETPLSRNARVGRGRAGPGRRSEAVHPRHQHDAELGRVVLVLAALPGPAQREVPGRPGERALLDGPAVRRRLRRRRPVRRRRWSTPSCTCCTRGSGTRCCSTWATSRRTSRTGGCSTRATSRRTRTATTAAWPCRPRRSSSATGATSSARSRSTASTARWASR